MPSADSGPAFTSRHVNVIRAVGAGPPAAGVSRRWSGSIHRLRTRAELRLHWQWLPDRQQGRHLSWQSPGERALHRAETEPEIFKMLDIPSEKLRLTHDLFASKGFDFILQQGHLTTAEYEYGITFTSGLLKKRTAF